MDGTDGSLLLSLSLSHFPAPIFHDCKEKKGASESRDSRRGEREGASVE